MSGLFQMPLFATCDLSARFAAHLEWIERKVSTTKGTPDGGGAITNCAGVVPLELLMKEMSIDVRPCGTIDAEPAYEYTYRIPFEGDPELWMLSPSRADEAFLPEGEIFRGHLIVSIVAASEEGGRRWFDENMRRINVLIEEQNLRIEKFNTSLKGEAHLRLTQMRGNGSPASAGDAGAATMH